MKWWAREKRMEKGVLEGSSPIYEREVNTKR
jgi:hypothetical protein